MGFKYPEGQVCTLEDEEIMNWNNNFVDPNLHPNVTENLDTKNVTENSQADQLSNEQNLDDTEEESSSFMDFFSFLPDSLWDKYDLENPPEFSVEDDSEWMGFAFYYAKQDETGQLFFRIGDFLRESMDSGTTTVNYERVKECYEYSAQLGYPFAMYNLAVMYQTLEPEKFMYYLNK